MRIVIIIIVGLFIFANSGNSRSSYGNKYNKRSGAKGGPPRQSLVKRAYKRGLISSDGYFDELSNKDKEILHELAMGIHKKHNK